MNKNMMYNNNKQKTKQASKQKQYVHRNSPQNGSNVFLLECHCLFVLCIRKYFCSVSLCTDLLFMQPVQYTCARNRLFPPFPGTFGEKTPWHLTYPIRPSDLPRKAPPGINRVSSFWTMQIVAGPSTSKWK